MNTLLFPNDLRYLKVKIVSDSNDNLNDSFFHIKIIIERSNLITVEDEPKRLCDASNSSQNTLIFINEVNESIY